MNSLGGYSRTTLLKKLGYQAGENVWLVKAPDWFIKELQTEKITIVKKLPATWAHGFFTSQEELAEFCERCNLSQIEKALWVSWPKKASKVPTNLTEQTFRDMILPLGWVDIKVAVIDDTWSGLKFTCRKI